MNILLIRNNAQMLMMVSGKFEYTDMESFALQFDGYLIEDKRNEDTSTHSKLYDPKSCYDFHPAMSSNTIRHKAWEIPQDREDNFISKQPTLDNYLRYLDTVGR